MTGVELRRARIVLLKATHWPYVAAIYAFESVKQRLNLGSQEEGLYASRSRSHKRPLLAGRNHSSPKIARYPGLRNRSEASLTSRLTTADGHVRHVKDTECLSEIKQVKEIVQKLSMQDTVEERLRTQEEMIERLSTQLGELTRRLAKPG
ncbi:MAG: hypothetical protein Q9191_004715, partial [Dirinaria sp. TL-2023a]